MQRLLMKETNRKFSKLTTTDLIDGADIQPGVVLLTEKQKHALQQCTELRSILRSKRLREDIHQVESSKDRRAALPAATRPKAGVRCHS